MLPGVAAAGTYCTAGTWGTTTRPGGAGRWKPRSTCTCTCASAAGAAASSASNAASKTSMGILLSPYCRPREFYRLSIGRPARVPPRGGRRGPPPPSAPRAPAKGARERTSAPCAASLRQLQLAIAARGHAVAPLAVLGRGAAVAGDDADALP